MHYCYVVFHLHHLKLYFLGVNVCSACLGMKMAAGINLNQGG